MTLPTPSQIASWYHSQIFRIPHGKQNPTKRYLTDDQILKLFGGTVCIQEKVDGKLSFTKLYYSDYEIVCMLHEDMTCKHTVHDHVMKYSDLPPNKRIELDEVTYSEYPDKSVKTRGFHVMPSCCNKMTYAILDLIDPTIEQIHQILGTIAQSYSHFGSNQIEGLVIKNYRQQLFGKWINDKFEDKLPDSK